MPPPESNPPPATQPQHVQPQPPNVEVPPTEPKPDKNVVVPEFQQITEGYDPAKLKRG